MRPTSLPRRSALAATAVAAGLLCSAAAAQADSVVYIDGGNVWSARPDGTAKVQLTTGGDWHSPTQADDGTIAAVQGVSDRISLMARDGRLIRTIQTQPAKSGDGGTFAARPVQLSLTPDGSRLAYSYVANSCPDGSTCGTIQRSTFYTSTNAEQATPQTLWGNQFGVSDPEWITNDRALVFGGYGSQVDIDPLPGGGDYSFVRWMRPQADLGDGELTRDMSRMVTTAFYGAQKILIFWAVSGDPRSETPPAYPAQACELNSPDEKLADPSWSPDGSSVAFQSSEGISVLRFTKLDADGCVSTGPAATLTTTGSEPDWGPADPPAARYGGPAPAASTPALATKATASTTVGRPAGGTPATTPSGPSRTVKSERLRFGLHSVERAQLRRGKVTVRVTVSRPGRIALRLSSGRTTIATGKARATHAGTVTVHLSRPTRKALAALSGRAGALLSGTLTTPGQDRVEQSRTLRVR